MTAYIHRWTPLSALSIRAPAYIRQDLSPISLYVSVNCTLRPRENFIKNPKTIIIMPKATATVNGHTVAETDSYELIEGNIYVRALVPIPFSLSYPLSCPLSYTTPVPALLPQPNLLHALAHNNGLSIQGHSVLLHHHNEQDGNQRRGVGVRRSKEGV
jgi:hypothetical protein